jgi:hypothetical protein
LDQLLHQIHRAAFDDIGRAGQCQVLQRQVKADTRRAGLRLQNPRPVTYRFRQ